MLKKLISLPTDFMVYTLLGEKQRKKIGDLLSTSQKEKLTRLLNGRKFEMRQTLKSLKHHLYNLGFTDQALADMETFLNNTDNMESRRLISFEMSLWHANKNTVAGAKEALKYLPVAASGEKRMDAQRRIAILTAECFSRLGKVDQAQELIHGQIERAPHADLYLAAANLESSIDGRFKWINKAMEMYHLAPVGFKSGAKDKTYDNLITLPDGTHTKVGPKVSVILPAYNAEYGIRIAIESILSQTWQNIELLVVDDCSPDSTRRTIEGYTRKDTRVKLLSTRENSGPYAARNIALKNATGEFVTINDADDWSHKQKIETQVQHLIENDKVIANTSEHARLTEEDMKLYRRGTPGRYIFPNMSSIMFRRGPVLSKLGSWDSVRFAADGEFKRRLVKVFGQKSYADLPTGPLSLPRQSVSSLTGSSAFGYDGFFMGVRKDYVEALEHHHEKADMLYYPENARPFPVPEPMWPRREEKRGGYRHFDVILAGDFRQNSTGHINTINQMKKNNGKIGLMQLYSYDLNINKDIDRDIRSQLDGRHIQMVVYGEKIESQKVVVTDPRLMHIWQKYRPEIITDSLRVEVHEPLTEAQTAPVTRHMQEYFGTTGTWHPHSESVRAALKRQHMPVSESARDARDE